MQPGTLAIYLKWTESVCFVFELCWRGAFLCESSIVWLNVNIFKLDRVVSVGIEKQFGMSVSVTSCMAAAYVWRQKTNLSLALSLYFARIYTPKIDIVVWVWVWLALFVITIAKMCQPQFIPFSLEPRLCPHFPLTFLIPPPLPFHPQPSSIEKEERKKHT